MGHKGIIRTSILLFAALSFFTLGVAAQDEPSVADAARRARQQKQASAKPSSVITNDTLAPAPATAAPSSAATADAATAAPQPAAEAPDSGEKKSRAETDDEAEQKKQEAAKLKEEIAQKQEQLRFLKSDLALKQDSFYSNPDHPHDADGKSRLDSMKSDIQQAQEELARLQTKLADLGPQEESKPAPPSKP
jgi:hypothetical protein